MKKVNKNIRTKLTALALAAVTACSVSAMAVPPAAALNSSIPTISDVEKFASDAKEGFEGIKEVFTGMSDKDISTLKKIGIETFMTCFGELVPGGKFITPALKVIAGDAFAARNSHSTR